MGGLAEPMTGGGMIRSASGGSDVGSKKREGGRQDDGER